LGIFRRHHCATSYWSRSVCATYPFTGAIEEPRLLRNCACQRQRLTNR
jgi:hypothetical protein